MATPSVAAQWIDTTLAAIREELPAPTIITRKLHLISAAMNDAFAAFDRKDDGAYPVSYTHLTLPTIYSV